MTVPSRATEYAIKPRMEDRLRMAMCFPYQGALVPGHRDQLAQKVKCAANCRVREGVPPDCSELITPKLGLPNWVFGLPSEG